MASVFLQQVSWKKYVTFLFLYSKICVLDHSSVPARVWSFCKIRLGQDERWRSCVTWVYFQHLDNGFCNQLSHKHFGCNINSVSCHLRRLCISSSSAPHPQNMFEKPLTWNCFRQFQCRGLNSNHANFDLPVLLNGYWFLLFGFLNCVKLSICVPWQLSMRNTYEKTQQGNMLVDDLLVLLYGYCSNSSKIVCIWQLPFPLVLPGGHQERVLIEIQKCPDDWINGKTWQ